MAIFAGVVVKSSWKNQKGCQALEKAAQGSVEPPPPEVFKRCADGVLRAGMGLAVLG